MHTQMMKQIAYYTKKVASKARLMYKGKRNTPIVTNVYLCINKC